MNDLPNQTHLHFPSMHSLPGPVPSTVHVFDCIQPSIYLWNIPLSSHFLVLSLKSRKEHAHYSAKGKKKLNKTYSLNLFHKPNEPAIPARRPNQNNYPQPSYNPYKRKQEKLTVKPVSNSMSCTARWPATLRKRNSLPTLCLDFCHGFSLI